MKVVTVTLNDEQYNILKKIRIVGDTNGDKLKNIFLEYASTQRDVQVDYEFYKQKLVWDKIMRILEMVWESYENGEDVVASWPIEKIEAIEHMLRGYMIITVPDKNLTYLPTHKIRIFWRRLFNRLIHEYPEMYEYSAACAATIYMVDEYSMGSLNDEELRDSTIILCEGWFFALAERTVSARRFMKTKKLYE